LKKKNPKHKVVRDSDSSAMVHDNAGENTTENNNRISANDNSTSSYNDD